MDIQAEVVFDLVDLLGVLTNGILGGVVARQLRMDLVGFVVSRSSRDWGAACCATPSCSRGSPWR